ncbi:MAG: hypothetical protein ABIZ36_13530 [Gemmatimonadaceae bacterium]
MGAKLHRCCASWVTPPAYPAELGDVILDDLLKDERCAAWLVDGLTSNRLVKSLAASTVEVVRKAAKKETQSTMQALFDARELSSIATRLGIPILVLKGGVRAITDSSPALPVVDWSLLGDGLPVDPGVWDRKETIPNAPGLFSLGRTDSLVHVARHALENYRQRSVSLRDAILAGVIAESCSDEEVGASRARFTEVAGIEPANFGTRGGEFRLRLVLCPVLPISRTTPSPRPSRSRVSVGRKRRRSGNSIIVTTERFLHGQNLRPWGLATQ